MTVREQFEHHFSEENLKAIYQSHIILSNATGIDNLSQKAFWPIIDEQVSIISNKVLAGSYKFTKYKLKLISKGRNKFPREISIPTIRDRIALRALCNFLFERYKDTINFELPQNMIRNAKTKIQSGMHNGFIKLDVSNFYPTIRHQELLKRLRRKIRNPEIIEFIELAIKTPTVLKSLPSDKNTAIGIPQGLSISNILATIYLLNIDKQLSSNSKIAYYRYVDDVFILCDYGLILDTSSEVIKKFKKLGLKIHDPIESPEKSILGKIGETFDYLGYKFEGDLVSPRDGAIEKLKESLVSIFTSYKHSLTMDVGFLLWRLNLRITGCVFQNKSKGWAFFFSEINNETILHNLDRHVKRLAERFDVSITPKRFVRTYYEIKHSKYETNYIPNFDTYSLDQMKDMLNTYFGLNVGFLKDEEIEYEFKKRIDKQVKDLLTDVQDFGY
ncbi:MAG: RNA-dependent DNA polymerase [Proteobacteria bacterium]|nr:RNA-dependent DNA polymerase [Pseudomonadota bacterium]